MLTREQKKKKVEELTQILSSARGVYVADYSGLDVEAISELRRICREAGIRFEVVKNSLCKFAVEKADIAELAPHFTGPTAIATSEEDDVVPARILIDFAKQHERPKVRAAYLEGAVYDEDGVKTLASLPPRDVLIGNLARALIAPLTKLAMVLNAPLRDLAGVLTEVGKKSGEGAGGSATPPSAEEAAVEGGGDSEESSESQEER